VTTSVPLKRACQISVSNVDKKADEGEVSVRLCNYVDVYYNHRISDNLEFMVATATPKQIKTFGLRQGDVLFTKDSETPYDIAVAALVVENLPSVVCGYHLAIARPLKDVTNGRYVYWALTAQPTRDQFTVFATGVTRYGLRQDEIGRVEIPLPTLHEQLAIADYLDAETARIDALITKKQRMVGLLEERLGTAIRHTLFTLSCERHPLKRRWKVIDCKHRTPNYLPEGIPVVSPGDATPGRLDLSRAHRFVGQRDFLDLADPPRLPRRGDIIYSRNASIGIASYVDTDEPFCMGQDVCLITSMGQSQLFLLYVLNTIGTDQLDEAKIGSTFSRINIAQIVELEIPIPEPNEQKRLGAEFDLMTIHTNTLTRTLQVQINLLQERRQALITAAVTGQLDIPEVIHGNH
jgi:type I restriction enzyme S subunit